MTIANRNLQRKHELRIGRNAMPSAALLLLVALCATVVAPSDGFTFKATTATRRSGTPTVTSLPAVEIAFASSESLVSADMAIPMEWTAFTSTVNTFFETQPYLASFLTCSVKASAADIIAQRQEEVKEEKATLEVIPEVDISRNLGFLLYGGLYTGCFQCFLYHGLFPMWFGSDGSWITLTKQLLADNLIVGPLLYLPVAYIFKRSFASHQGLSLETSRQALETYLEDVSEHHLLETYWAMWIPLQLLTYSLIPSHFRVVCGPGELLLVLFTLDKIFQRRKDMGQNDQTNNREAAVPSSFLNLLLPFTIN